MQQSSIEMRKNFLSAEHSFSFWLCSSSWLHHINKHTHNLNHRSFSPTGSNVFNQIHILREKKCGRYIQNNFSSHFSFSFTTGAYCWEENNFAPIKERAIICKCPFPLQSFLFFPSFYIKNIPQPCFLSLQVMSGDKRQ